MPKPSDGMIHALAFLLLTVLVLWFLSRSSGSSRNSARPSRCDSCRRPEAAKHPPRPAREGHVPASAILVGTAHATDADGIRANGREIRLARLDSPEWDQPAKRHGQWFNHGKFAKEAPAQEIGGRHVHVHVQGQDRYGRLIGVVACEGRDINEWLIREGRAMACYGNRYSCAEARSKAAKSGMWAHEVNVDPRDWRRRRAKARNSGTTRPTDRLCGSKRHGTGRHLPFRDRKSLEKQLLRAFIGHQLR